MTRLNEIIPLRSAIKSTEADIKFCNDNGNTELAKGFRVLLRTYQKRLARLEKTEQLLGQSHVEQRQLLRKIRFSK